ncbi:hypothetical protein [Winogradskya consettensis]|uniref:hypothetical protein n=1 Tax=Winogradskya consettensis TaxID=113560 RepID=UPI001BB32CAA|nr:hypothetical protein [Actinoplanes consettensis]
MEELEEGADFGGGDAEGGGALEDGSLGAGAVQEVEDFGCCGVAEVDQDRAGGVQAELQGVGASPDAGQARQQHRPMQHRSAHV